MRRPLVIFISVLCLALPLYAGEDQNEKTESAVVTLTLDTEIPEVVSSMSWGIAEEATRDAGTGTPTGKRQHKPLTITKTLSKSSNRLFAVCAKGDHFKKVVISVRKAGSKGKDYLIITMSDVLINSYSVDSQSDSPTETISLFSANVDYEIPAGQ